jgi:hypothetical protein
MRGHTSSYATASIALGSFDRASQQPRPSKDTFTAELSFCTT